jgi:hypothetical protein
VEKEARRRFETVVDRRTEGVKFESEDMETVAS